jgi:MYXO-CTERM domain-containing protein
MNKTRLLAIVGLFAAAVANASAQAVGDQYSYSQFNIYTSDPSVVVTPDGGGPYDYYPAFASGAATNSLISAQFAYGTAFGYNYVSNSSETFGAGSAYQFNGMNYYYDIDNTSATAQNIQLYVLNEQLEEVQGDSIAESYAGVQEIGGAGIYAYHTVELDSSGLPSEFTVGTWTDDYTTNTAGYSHIQSDATFDDTLAAGESVRIQFWASGYSSASTPASSVPGPVAALPFAVAAALGGRRRRRAVKA